MYRKSGHCHWMESENMCFMIYYTITAISTNQGSLKKLVWYFSISTFLIHSRRNSCFRCNPIQNHNYPYGLTYFENFSLTSFQMLLPTWWIVTQAFCTIWIKFNSICNKLTIMLKKYYSNTSIYCLPFEEK